MSVIVRSGTIAILTLFLTGPAISSDWKDRLKQTLRGDDDTESSLAADEVAGGLKEALAKGLESAVNQLGRPDGFLADEAVRIAVPERLRSLTKTARRLGADKYVDEFETTMNRAAETAVPEAADIFVSALSEMSFSDAMDILKGEDDAATQYFRSATGEQLNEAFLPIVRQATESTGATRSYKTLQSKAGGILGGLIDTESMDLDQYVTDSALDGLFHYVAVQEKAIREDPIARTSDLLRRVFGT